MIDVFQSQYTVTVPRLIQLFHPRDTGFAIPLFNIPVEVIVPYDPFEEKYHVWLDMWKEFGNIVQNEIAIEESQQLFHRRSTVIDEITSDSD